MTTSHSQDLAKFAEAMAAAQAQMTGALKDKKNPFFKSSFADLKSIIYAIRGPLSDHGICFVQSVGNNEQGWPVVTTTLVHKSGQWISDSLALKPLKMDPQSMGSAITYARRYSLASMVGIPQIDDDGESHIDRSPQKKQAKISGRYGQKSRPKPEPKTEPKPEQAAAKETGKKTMGELRTEALKDFPSIHKNTLLNREDFCVGDGPWEDLPAKDAHGWQDAAVLKAREIGISQLNGEDRALAFLAKRLKTERDKSLDASLEKSKTARAQLHNMRS